MASQRESTHVTFTIESVRLTAKQIEEQVGLKPDVSWVLGAERGAFGARAKTHGFVLDSTLSPNMSFDMHVGEMLKRLMPYAQKLGAITDLDIEFAVIMHRKAGPAVDVKRDDLRWLGVMGARLRIDVQIVSDSAKAPAAAGAKPEEKK